MICDYEASPQRVEKEDKTRCTHYRPLTLGIHVKPSSVILWMAVVVWIYYDFVSSVRRVRDNFSASMLSEKNFGKPRDVHAIRVPSIAAVSSSKQQRLLIKKNHEHVPAHVTIARHTRTSLRPLPMSSTCTLYSGTWTSLCSSIVPESRPTFVAGRSFSLSVFDPKIGFAISHVCPLLYSVTR